MVALARLVRHERLHDPKAIGLHIKAGTATAGQKRERQEGRKDSA